MTDKNIISFSGGKDSTAMLLLAIELETPNLSAVFADTGNEHQQTYDYVVYVEQATGIHIRRVKADFTARIQGKSAYVLEKWPDKLAQIGYSHAEAQETIERATAALQPTGNPFLDLCIWKGRFPSTKAAFCSEELKRNPIIEQVQLPFLDEGHSVISWQGVRRDESLRRRHLSKHELKGTFKSGAELWNYRPILDWKAEDCFAMHKKHGIRHNPLYEHGMGRVGCMPCINCRKDELLEISRRFPEEIARIAEWERIVGQASKRGISTFFPLVTTKSDAKHTSITLEDYGVHKVVEWSKTSRGGKQFDFIRVADNDGPACSSIYGLCE